MKTLKETIDSVRVFASRMELEQPDCDNVLQFVNNDGGAGPQLTLTELRQLVRAASYLEQICFITDMAGGEA